MPQGGARIELFVPSRTKLDATDECWQCQEDDQAVNNSLMHAMNALRVILGMHPSQLKNIGVCAKIVLGIDVTKDDVLRLVKNSEKSKIRK